MNRRESIRGDRAMRGRSMIGAMKTSLGAVAMGLLLAATPGTASATDLTFYYPVAVGGPITKIVDDMVAGFRKENADVTVKAVYAGTYQDTLTKALTAMKGGEPPHLAVLLSTDMFTLIDEKAIVPWDEVATGADDGTWIGSFYPGFMANSQTGGKTWGIPFQRSTIVMYWNKEGFKEARLDPDHAPQNLDQLIA